MKTLHFKKLLFSLFFIGLCSPYFSSLQAQFDTEDDMPIVVFSYMKSKNADYMKMEKEIWQPYMKQAIKEGDLDWWGIYQVQFPSGKNTEYDFVAVNVFPNIGKMETTLKDMHKKMKIVHSEKDIEKLMKRTEASRDLVWQEAFTAIGKAIEGDGTPAMYSVVNRMQSLPGKYNDYIRMEVEVFQPAHTLSAKKGYRKNWHFLSRTMPYGDEYGYDFLTIDTYNSLKQMSEATPAHIWRDSHPDKDIEAMWEELNPNKLRKLKRGEVWKNVLYEKKPSTVADNSEKE